MEDQAEQEEKRRRWVIQEWGKHHYGTAARWVKEVALLTLASLVVQRFLSHGAFDDPVVARYRHHSNTVCNRTSFVVKVVNIHIWTHSSSSMLVCLRSVS